MSVIHRFEGNSSEIHYAWEGVSPIEINTQDVRGVLKHVLVGPEDNAPSFIIRYFQVPVGGCTFYHQHAHEHGILILHGQARLQINKDFHDLAPMDAVFISGKDLHQLTNRGDIPLGFICIIPSVEE